MKLRILGCGTSSGVPRIGNDWGACDPTDPRNRRTRASIIVETDTTRILVDTGPDMREQLLAANVVKIDAILWTHDHADHCHGIDDVRQLFHARGEPLTAYAPAETIASLKARFAYAFFGRDGYPPTIAAHALTGDNMIGDIRVRLVMQPHGAIFSAGFRFEHEGMSIGYSTDFHEVTNDMRDLFSGLDIWVVDCLRAHPHPTHAYVALTLAAIAHCRPRQAILTHMDQSLDYAKFAASLPENVAPGHDGLEIIV